MINEKIYGIVTFYNMINEFFMVFQYSYESRVKKLIILNMSHKATLVPPKAWKETTKNLYFFHFISLCALET
jgi:hypothetical protein